MAKQTVQPIDESPDRDAALLVLIGDRRDELHRLAAEIAEDVATPARHLHVAERLCQLSQQLGSRADRVTVDRGAPDLMPDERTSLTERASLSDVTSGTDNAPKSTVAHREP